MSWKTFEEECTSYLNRKYGIKFEQQGESDSTVSDILYCGEKKCFYIEAKMPNAQCGQFVLLPNFKKGVFKYSSKNKANENEYTRMIIDFMNSNFYEFCDSGTAGSDINMPKSVFYGWIVNYYKEKGADSLNSSNKSDFEYAMGIAGIDFSFSGLDIISDRNLDGVKVNGKKYDYLLRENGSTYKVRKLSNTRNANVIFSIELMDYDVEEQKKDVIQFENTISK